MPPIFRLFAGFREIFISFFVGFYIISIIANVGNSCFNVFNVSAFYASLKCFCIWFLRSEYANAAAVWEMNLISNFLKVYFI